MILRPFVGFESFKFMNSRATFSRIPQYVLLLNQSRTIHVARTVDEMRICMKKLQGNLVGFVPTMGALHEGHISLVDRARKENDFVVASIYVNPTQFSAGEDLDKYPRTFESDIDMLRKSGVEYVFYPSTEEMYPKDYLCYVEPKAFGTILEGQARPDFFRGVATMVSKLFNIINPTKSYFGQKDISQCILLKSMVKDLHIPTEVIVCPTMRERDGLAMSSRNVYLTTQERAAASILYRALLAGKEYCEKNDNDNSNSNSNSIANETSREDIIKQIETVLHTQPLISHIEYISIASPINMKELATVGSGAVLSAAVRCGNVRLIDNLLVGTAKAIIEYRSLSVLARYFRIFEFLFKMLPSTRLIGYNGLWPTKTIGEN
eukprot:gene774-1486_t